MSLPSLQIVLSEWSFRTRAVGKHLEAKGTTNSVKRKHGAPAPPYAHAAGSRPLRAAKRGGLRPALTAGSAAGRSWLSRKGLNPPFRRVPRKQHSTCAPLRGLLGKGVSKRPFPAL